MFRRKVFFNHLIKEIMHGAKCTYSEALKEVKEFEKTDQYEISYQQYLKVHRIIDKQSYSEKTHIRNRL